MLCFCCLQSEIFQDDLYPATASICPSITTDEWLRGLNRGPILMSLKVRRREVEVLGSVC